jgi:hypothetical protein
MKKGGDRKCRSGCVLEGVWHDGGTVLGRGNV